MTNEEAKQFVQNVLKGLWPRWEPNEEELRGWVRRLEPCDYEKSRLAVNNMFFESTSRGIDPPAGKIIKLLRKQITARQSEPVLLYTLIRERLYEIGRRKGMNYYGDSGKDPKAIENEAENMRERCNQMYGENHIIMRHWDANL